MNEDGTDPIVASSNDIKDALTEYFTHNPLQQLTCTLYNM